MKNEMENLSFEEALEKLETLVRQLESGQIKLEEAIKAYEEGCALEKVCEDKLKTAQMKVEKLILDKQGIPQGVEPLDADKE